MQGRGDQIARLRSDFYRDKFRKLLNWLFGCIFIIFILIASILYLIYFEPSRQYYGNTTDGKILSMVRPVS
jgi:hypothetical protein